MNKQKLLVVFGTRPEAIKLFPVIHALRDTPGIVTRVCVTGQHRGLLDSVLDLAGIVPDADLDLMAPGQSLDELFHGGLTFRHEPKLGLQAGEIAGHLHPAATVRRREKSVRRPCFASDGRRLLMPAFGVLTGGLDLKHRAMAGLFDHAALIAHLMGRDRIYSVRYGNLGG